MSIDTQEQALAEARKRWGDKYGWVNASTNSREWDAPMVYCVGVNSLYRGVSDHWRDIYYVGDSWDAAFADADRKQDV